MKKILCLLIVFSFLLVGCGKKIAYYSSDELLETMEQYSKKINEYIDENNIDLECKANVDKAAEDEQFESIVYSFSGFYPSGIIENYAESRLTKNSGNITLIKVSYHEPPAHLEDRSIPSEWLLQGNSLMKCIISLYSDNVDSVFEEITQNNGVDILIDETYYTYTATDRDCKLLIEDSQHFKEREKLNEAVQKEYVKTLKKESINTTIDKLLINGKDDDTMYHIEGRLKNIKKDDSIENFISYNGIINDDDGNFIDASYSDNGLDYNPDKCKDFYGTISKIGDTTRIYIYHME